MLSTKSIDYLNEYCERKGLKAPRGKTNRLFLKGRLLWLKDLSNGVLSFILSCGEHGFEIIVSKMFEERQRYVKRLGFNVSVSVEAVSCIDGIECSKIRPLDKRVEYDRQMKIGDY